VKHSITRPKYPNLALLAALVLLIFASPFVNARVLGFGITDVGIILVLATSLVNVARHRIQTIAGLAMLVLVMAMRVSRVLSGAPLFDVAYLTLVLTFLVFMTVLMTRDVLSNRTVTLDTICESLAVYMLMGLTWGIAFQLLEFAEPGSFNFPPDRLAAGVEPMQRILSFSYVTLTTLGYGNITPATPKADSLTSAEALLGQIYITVLVARLVALQIHHSSDPPPTDPT